MRLLSEFPTCDVIYGIRRENIASRLSVENWQSKAVVRVEKDDAAIWHYLWIRKSENKGEECFYVRCSSGSEHSTVRASESVTGFDDLAFADLGAALRYINGEEESSLLARRTRLALPAEYPPDSPPSAILIGLPLRR